MALTLAIENQAQLPDGGPTSIQISGRRGIDIGRDQHLDWTLPDPERVISGKHCEIRYYDGGFWLHDLSRNGTFVNGSDRRLHAPHRLRNDDRLEIGNYIISVKIDGAEAEAPSAPGPAPEPAPQPAALDRIWDDDVNAAPPIASADLRVAKETPSSGADFLDWVVDMPEVGPEPAFRPKPAADPYANSPWQDTPPRQAPAEPYTAPAPDPAGGASGPFEPPPPASQFSPPEPTANPAMPRAYGTEGFANDPDILNRIARGAGVPPELLGGKDPGKTAEELGALVRIAVENLRQLLAARAESRRMMGGGRQTMIQALDNNPIKFCPTTDDALRIMLGPRTQGYLGSEETLRQSFDDLKKHQLATFAAMQKAVAMLMAPFDPKEIEEAAKRGLMGSRKAALWDAYVERWEAMLAEHDNGFIDAFVGYFSQCYQRGEEDS